MQNYMPEYDSIRESASLLSDDVPYQQLVELAPVAILILQAGKLVYANSAAAAMFGVPQGAALLDLPLLEMLHPDKRRADGHYLQEITSLNTGTVFLNTRMIRRDGLTIESEISARPVRYGGRPAVFMVVRDVTVQREAEQRQERELRLLDQVRTTLAHEMDLAAVFVAVVEAISAILSYSHVSLYIVEDGALRLQHQIGYEHVLERIPLSAGVAGRVARTGKTSWLPDVSADPSFLAAIPGIRSEICVPLLDLYPSPPEGPPAVVGVLNVETTGARLLTEEDRHLLEALSSQVSIAMGRARLYTALRESEARYRGLAEAAREGIILHNQGRIMDANQAAADMFGYTVPELQQLTALDLVVPELRDTVLNYINQEHAAPYESVGVRKDESRFPVEVLAHSVPYHGTLTRVVTLRDMTAHKQAEAERERLIVELQRSLSRTEALYRVGRSLVGVEDLETILQTVVDSAATALPADSVLVMILRPEVHAITHLVVGGSGPVHILPMEEAELEEGLTGWVLRTHQALLSKRGAADSRQSPALQARRAATGCGAVMIAPLIYRDQLLGILSATNRADQPDFMAADLDLLRALADQAATALAQVQRFQEIRLQARTDPLTALANRRYFLAAADQALAAMRAKDRPLALILLDIDHFKVINDSHGHPVGDEVLRALSARLHNSLRSDDLLGRLGGEEFGVLLPNTPSNMAHEIAQRLCQVVAATPFSTTIGPVRVTISLGVTNMIRGDNHSAELLSRSDKALYAAKAAGRNQVAVQEWGGVQLLSPADDLRQT